jgi:hypothetical protein
MRREWAFVTMLQALPEVAAAQSPPREPPPVAPEQQPAALPHPWRSRPLAFDAVLGIATPYGAAGLSADYAPIEHLSLGGGIGTNVYGWQLAGMARLRFTPEQRSSVYAGAGYSQGRHYQWDGNRDGVFSLVLGPMTANGHDTRRSRTWETARWLNFELGIERRQPRGFDLRFFTGGAFMLNPSASEAAKPSTSDDRSDVVPVRGVMIYAGTALGFSI